MDLENLKCDIREVLESEDNMNILLQKWRLSCQEFRSHVAVKIEKKLLYEEDCDKKKSVKYEELLEIQNEINKVKFDVDAIIQQQKISDKKILNITTLQKSLKDESENLKVQRDNFLLNIVDIKQEHEQKRKKKFSKWNAIKRGCNTYKSNLNMYLELKEEQNDQHAKISFFINSLNDELSNKYFAQLLFSNGQWSVEQIEPTLKKEHLNQLISVAMDSSEPSKILEITLFLCELRSIFLKHYMKKETANHSADK
nr:PREDICTED: uncharacterized protein LOC105678304 [Linepithema humile]